jgi:hypothetical protein
MRSGESFEYYKNGNLKCIRCYPTEHSKDWASTYRSSFRTALWQMDYSNTCILNRNKEVIEEKEKEKENDNLSLEWAYEY